MRTQRRPKLTQPRKLKRSVLKKSRSRFDKYSGQSSVNDSGPVSEEEFSPEKDLSLNRMNSSPKVSEMVHKHSSFREPGTTNTMSSIGIPDDHNVKANTKLEFIGGREVLKYPRFMVEKMLKMRLETRKCITRRMLFKRLVAQPSK